MITRQCISLCLMSLLIPLAASGGPLVIADGETFLVLANEDLETEDVVVNGTFRNQGEVRHSGLFENFGFTDNQGQFNNQGEFHNSGGLTNSGVFINAGSFINNAGALLESTGGFIASGYTENRGVAEFAELSVGGVLENYGELTTGADYVHVLTGFLSNSGQWMNAGYMQLGLPGLNNSGLFRNTGEYINFGTLGVDAVFINSGQIINNGFLEIEGQLINEGELLNDGFWIVDDNFQLGISEITNTGTIINSNLLEIDRRELALQGEWINTGEMRLTSDQLRVEGALRNYADNMRVFAPVAVVSGGVLEQGGGVMIIDGDVVNHGTVLVATDSTLETGQFENHGDVRVDTVLRTGPFVQNTGSTVFSGFSATLIAPSVQIYGGLVAFDAEFGSISGPSLPDAYTMVEMFGGTISAGAGALTISGDLILYDDATMAVTIGDDTGHLTFDDFAVTGHMSMAGALVIGLEPGAMIAVGDIWTIASALSFSGMFENVTLPSVAGINFELFIEDLGLEYLNLRAVEAVPLPLPLVLFMSASGVLFGFQRSAGAGRAR